MSTHLILVSHNNIAAALLKTIQQIFGGSLPLVTSVISVDNDSDRDKLFLDLQAIIDEAKQEGGCLILTDLFGATPNNIARAFCQEAVSVISGLNLPMLVRIMNYPGLSLAELTKKAIDAGKQGITSCNQE